MGINYIESSPLRENSFNVIIVALTLSLFSALNVNAQVLERGRAIKLNLGVQSEYLRNSGSGNIVSGQNYGQSFSEPEKLAPYETSQKLGDFPSKNLNKSDVEVYRSFFRKILEDLGINIDEIFPEGLPNYFHLFETVPKGGNYLHSLNELIDAAKKFISEGWTFLNDEENNFVRQLLSFFDADGKCIIDEEHKKYLPENVFPGVEVEKSRILSNGCIYIPTKNGFYVIDKYGKCRKIDFDKIFKNTFITPYFEYLDKFIKNPNELTAVDFGIAVNYILTALEGASLGEDFDGDEQLGDEDLHYYILNRFCGNAYEKKLLNLCLKGQIVFAEGYVDIGKDRYYYTDVIDKEEVNKAVSDGYTVHGKSVKGDIPWIIRNGKLDWVVPKNSKSSLEDSIYNGRLDVSIENPSDGYDGLEGSSGSIILDEVVKNPGEGIIHNHK